MNDTERNNRGSCYIVALLTECYIADTSEHARVLTARELRCLPRETSLLVFVYSIRGLQLFSVFTKLHLSRAHGLRGIIGWLFVRKQAIGRYGSTCGGGPLQKLRLRRGRLCAVLSLVCVYLAGVLLLSSVSIDPHYYSNGLAHSLRGGVGGRHLGSIEMPAGARGQAGGGVGGAGRRARSRLHWCRPLHFLSPPGPVVALVSFPGSGNTWLRYLLQQATGVYTGSVYKDFGLLKNGFPAESVCNGSVLVVKTHESGPEARAPFSRAVLLVRAPAAAIVAEFNRQSGGHVGFASPDRYHRNRGKYWESFVRSMVGKWRALNLDWLRSFPGELLVARYEALAAADGPALRAHLLRLLRFLRADAAVSAQQLACTVARREGIYRRRRRAAADAFDPFSEDMKRDLRAAEDEVFAAIRDFQLRQQRLLGAGVDPGPTGS
ncbi:WSCD family member AGAP003962-like [Schistocerca gregaria]|uniref:WSCD family member AGAP003962-like n=1 Tax=Schistocerca gregaria TaxID=7010 RepID=UPI00211EA6C8|nr:WSCD family member AGAP003962-like [Schistocerca gregaria]